MKCLLLGCCLWLSFALHAQPKKDTLQTVTVSSNRNATPFSSIQKIDAPQLGNFRHQDMSSLLLFHSNVFVKNYGPGSLSTFSIRGSSAAQTQVLWNGININNSATGLSDLSTLPVAFFDQVSIEYGSSPGSQSVAGSLNLQQTPPTFYRQQETSLALGYESLRNRFTLLQVKKSGGRIANDCRIMVTDAANSYRYYNPERQRNETLTHARTQKLALLNDLSLRLRHRDVLSLHTWLQLQDREIPAATFEENSLKEEHLQTMSLLLQYRHPLRDHIEHGFSLGYFNEQYRYRDPAAWQDARADVINVPLEAHIAFWFNTRHKLNLQSRANYAYMLDRPGQDIARASLEASYTWENILRRFDVQAALQQEVANRLRIPLIGSIVVSARLPFGLKASLSYATRYRMPTLNEWYYFPGGNTNLKPEFSRNIEAGLRTQRHTARHALDLDASVFRRHVRDWIAWYGGAILTPHNIQQVHSRGLEFMGHYEYTLRAPEYAMDTTYIIEVQVAERPRPQPAIVAFTNLFYAYTLSTTEASYLQQDYSIGRQIPYVPRYQLRAEAGLRLGRLSCSWLHTYTGYRFVTTDESQYLQPFFTGNIMLSYDCYHGRNTWKFNARLNNVFNANYESVVGRVMPGRNGSVGVMWKRGRGRL